MLRSLNLATKFIKAPILTRSITTATQPLPSHNIYNDGVEGRELSQTVTRVDVMPDSVRFKGPLKYAILDWSGTTADADVIAPATVFKDVFDKHDLSITMEEARLPMGLRKDLHIAEILQIPRVKKAWTEKFGDQPTQDDVATLFADFVPMQLSCLKKYTTLIPGTVEAINELRTMGIKIGSTTGFTKVMVDVLLEESAKQGYVPDSSVAGDQVRNNLGFRPAPFMLYENLIKMGGWPIQSVVKVDDTVSGVQEGVNAGCWRVGLSRYSNYTNVNSLEERANLTQADADYLNEKSKAILLESGAHYVADSIKDLPSIARDINQRLESGEHP